VCRRRGWCLRAGAGHPLLHGEGRGRRPGPEQVVPAAVPRLPARDRPALGHRVLRETGQRVGLREHADDAGAGPVVGDEGRRHARDARLRVEAGRAELLLQEGAALHLLVAGRAAAVSRDPGCAARAARHRERRGHLPGPDSARSN
jgi:hypothetical protein